MSKTYRNYIELFEDERELALELIDEKGKGEWQQNEIYYHEDVEFFAEHELIDGWYVDLNLDRNFNRIRQKSPILYRWVMNAVR
ncbi:hypothetical protein L5H76_14575, partial [Enterococcus faecium]|nr:hypothetical protein [Enterococcus faecium]